MPSVHSPIVLLCLCCVLGCSKQPAGGQAAPGGDPWASMPSVRRGSFRIYDKTRDAGQAGIEHDLYIGGKGISPPRHFYTHSRAVDIILSNSERYLLLNDAFATKANKVVVVDIATGLQRDAGAEPLAEYRRTCNPDKRLWILSVGKGFSPDDRCVLVEIELVFVNTSDYATAGELGDGFARRWYLVSAGSGSVVSELKEAPSWYAGRTTR